MIARLLLGLIAGYRRFISPVLPAACRFEPTCSAYMAEAVEVHGAAKGVFLGIKRIGRCRPGGGIGFDPVPPRVSRGT